jgi:hypothetical protein
MEPDAQALLAEHPEWRLILATYAREESLTAERLAASREKSPTQPVAAPADSSPSGAADGPEPQLESPSDPESKPEPAESRGRPQIWVRRQVEIAGVPSERLAALHGRLIAEGLLQFSLSGREEGVVYRLASEARRALGEVGEASDLPDEPSPVEAEAA